STQDVSNMLSKALDLVEQGQLAAAKQLYEAITAAEPGHAEAWMMLGTINAETGQPGPAQEQLQRAIELDPSMPEAHYYLANLQRSQGNLDDALASLEKAVANDDSYGEAWSMLGGICGMLERHEQAEMYCRRAAELLPDSPGAQMNLANTLFRQGKAEEAAGLYQQLLNTQPDLALAWYMLGSSLTALGQLDEAADAFRKAIELDPNHAESRYGLGYVCNARHDYADAAEHFRQALRLLPRYAQAENGLASTLQALGQYREALDHYDEALKLFPGYAEAQFGRGSTLMVLGESDAAIQNLQEAIRLNPEYSDAYITLASALMTKSRPDEAMACCEKALQINPDNADAVALTATIEQHAGDPQQALARLQPWIERGIDNINLAVAFAEVSKSLDRPDDAIELMERLLAQDQALPVTSQRNLHFNLGRLYDATGRYADAFEHYRKGNEARAMEFDAAAHAREIDAIIETFSQDFMAGTVRAGQRSEKPVFVVGMPRSGTSLVEQILASHPSVYGAGELPDLLQMVTRLPETLGSGEGYPRCVSALNQAQADALAAGYLQHLDELSPDAARVIDKMPGNFRFLGPIELLFPGARVIHCLRDPLDTCLSCYFQDFSRTHAYSYDLARLADYYRDYRRLMAHWKEVLQIPVLEVRYEELIENQETVSRAMVDFCGLEWDDSCLRFHETERFVATASYDQVRRPLYKKSVARWKHYEEHLGPLIEALG
ncbi:MAG TPA: sulfotransferase family protein, partial [Gammaproteobacteria bacterium]|nr:sulfotransferase family protein [Gammaproteobacteria bacterium]